MIQLSFFPRGSRIFRLLRVLLATAAIICVPAYLFPTIPSHILHSDRSITPFVYRNQISKGSARLSLSSFPWNHRYEPQDIHRTGRYESVDVWRPSASYEYPWQWNSRPHIPNIDQFASLGQYLKQPIIADYAEGSEKLFVMLKTGGSELWRKLPVQMLTTLTRIPYFTIYSDSPGSIAGHEVVDVFENFTDTTLNSDEFEMYRAQRYLHDSRGMWDYSETTLEQGWQLDRFKNVPMLAHAYQVPPRSVDWFMFFDADTYVFFDTLMQWLKQFDVNQPHYLGSMSFVDNKPFAHGGTGVVISRSALKIIFGESPQSIIQEYVNRTFDICCGDAMTGVMLQEKAGIEINTGYVDRYLSVFQGNPVWDLEIRFQQWCDPILSFHHVTPHDIEILWEYERLKGPQNRKSITRLDVYLDFISPYIDSVVENWDNGANELEYSNETDKAAGWKPFSEGGPLVRPYESVEKCREACEEISECISWRHVPVQNKCALSTSSLRLGRSSQHWLKSDIKILEDATISSGWMIDRIREQRRSRACDPLYDDINSEGKNDGSKSDRVEGWHRRLASRSRL